MKITKEVTFDSAHLLSFYDGKCANLHGHTYRLQVSLESEIDEISRMLMDFNILRQVIDESVMNIFDHALLLSSNTHRSDAENELLQWAEQFGKKYCVMPGMKKTTCEDMSEYIKSLVEENLCARGIPPKVSIRLWETPTSFVEC